MATRSLSLCSLSFFFIFFLAPLEGCLLLFCKLCIHSLHLYCSSRSLVEVSRHKQGDSVPELTRDISVGFEHCLRWCTWDFKRQPTSCHPRQPAYHRCKFLLIFMSHQSDPYHISVKAHATLPRKPFRLVGTLTIPASATMIRSPKSLLASNACLPRSSTTTRRCLIPALVLLPLWPVRSDLFDIQWAKLKSHKSLCSCMSRVSEHHSGTPVHRADSPGIVGWTIRRTDGYTSNCSHRNCRCCFGKQCHHAVDSYVKALH